MSALPTTVVLIGVLLSPASPASPPSAALAVGETHACALRDGRVYCWGGPDCAERTGDGFDCWTAVEVPWLADVVGLYSKAERTCARERDGERWCWSAPRRGVPDWPEPDWPEPDAAEPDAAEPAEPPPEEAEARWPLFPPGYLGTWRAAAAAQAFVRAPEAVDPSDLRRLLNQIDPARVAERTRETTEARRAAAWEGRRRAWVEDDAQRARDAAQRANAPAPEPPATRTVTDRAPLDHPAVWSTALVAPETFRGRTFWSDRPEELCALGPAGIECWRDVMPWRAGGGWRHRVTPWPATELVPGKRLACGRSADGAVWCHRSRADDFRATPVTAPGEARAVAVGGGFTCAIGLDDTARCWGRNYGPAPGAVVGQGVTAITVGAGYELPLTDAEPSPRLVDALAGARITAIASDMGGIAALTADGQLFEVQPGDLRSAKHARMADWPALQPTASGVATVTAGLDRICALDGRGRVRCLGSPLTVGDRPCWRPADSDATCPRGATLTGVRAAVPFDPICRGSRLPDLPWEYDGTPIERGVVYIDRHGRLARHCAVDGPVLVGEGPKRRLRGKRPPAHPDSFGGEPPYDVYTESFTETLPAFGRAEAIAAGGSAMCVRRADGEVACWGEVRDDPEILTGRIVLEVRLSHALPARPALDAAGGLAVSPTHACGLGADRRIRCVGFNVHGQLGAPPIDDEVVRINLPGTPIRPTGRAPTDGAARVAAVIAEARAR